MSNITRSQSDCLRLVYTGNYGEAHDVSNLLSSLQYCHQQGISTSLTFALSRISPSLKHCISDYPELDINFVPLQSNSTYTAWIRQFDFGVVLLKPNYSGVVFPSKMLGYISSGIPIVYSGPCNQASYIITTLNIGVHDQLRKPEYLFSFFSQVLQNPNLYPSICNAITDARSHFDREHSLSSIVNLITEVV